MTSTRGNALFLILLAVAFFAGLSYAMTQAGRGPRTTADSEYNVIAAVNIIQYSNAVKSAILRLRVSSDCSDTQISFDNPGVQGYANAASPIDQSCHVFHRLGGGVAFPSPPTMTMTQLGYEFSGANIFYGLGSPEADLAMFLPIDSLDLCRQINKALGLPLALAVDRIENRKFTGTYVSTNGIPDEDGNIEGFKGAWAACLQAKGGETDYPQTAGANYFFYNVLIAR